MRVAIGADHAGYAYKAILAPELEAAGHAVLDEGTFGPEPVDYPDFAAAVAGRVTRDEADRGILLCGSGVGVCVVANKVPGIRAALCHDTYSARQGVEHDDMNVLCLGERVIGIAIAREVVERFLAARFSGEPRHQRRIDKLLAVERRHLSSNESTGAAASTGAAEPNEPKER